MEVKVNYSIYDTITKLHWPTILIDWGLLMHQFIATRMTISNFVIIFDLFFCKALKRGIKVRMSRKEVLEKTGELISLRFVNHCSICSG